MADEKKIGVYLCTGCGIGEALNIDELEAVAKKEFKVPICKRHEFLCSRDGLQVIKDDMNNEGVNKVVVAACSPRVHTDLFAFDPMKYVVERVNLREQVVWTQPKTDAGKEGSQLMAADYLRMGITRIGKSNAHEPKIIDVNRTLLIVGGGVTGLTAALEASQAGYKSVIVEKSGELGGNAKKMFKVFPTAPPFAELEKPTIDNKIQAAKNDSNITIHTNATVACIEGGPGMYKVTIDKNGASDTFDAGAVVLASGWRPYDPSNLGGLGYGKFRNVITNLQMEEMVTKNNGKVLRPSDGKIAKSVVFVQCAGQRDEKHVPYCSTVCCNVSLKQAKYVRESNPDAGAFVIYKDMRTLGLYENFYKTAQDDEGIFLAKGEVLGIQEGPEGNLYVEINNQLLGMKMQINADLVVLATGMVSGMVPEDRGVNNLTPEYIGNLVKRETSDGEIVDLEPLSLALNLKYRQGPEMPHLKWGFPDSHFICFPYETRRTGIYSAGAVRHPMDAVQSVADATGAALKAIQCIELTAQGRAVHPRTWDRTYPEIRFESCTQCRRCTVECPFGAYDEESNGTPLQYPSRCRRCGVCMGACPQRVISFKDYSVDMISSMLKTIEVPDSGTFVIGFVCENDAYPAFDMVGLNRMALNTNFRFISLRCLGGLNLVWIADALSRGVDGILLLGCKYGDDYQCHYVKGSQMANERLGKVQETLDRLMLESERVEQVQLAINDWQKLPSILEEFAKKIEDIGENPYKGF
uniref:Putative adenylylsulfate reductase-associated electron transfer protein QmoB n=1 Tax=Chlorobium chlorochromatii (strain CaD3) TaxID=340177 RepID=Q3AQ87_CHLCH